MKRLEIQYLRTSMLLVRWEGRRILTDPWFAMHMRGLPVFVRPVLAPEDLPPLDFVLVSHFHPDHFDRKALARLRHPIGLLAGPPGIEEKCGGLRCGRVAMLADGENVEDAGFRITAYAVEHSGYENAYIVEKDSLSLLFAGDANYSPAFARIGERHRPLVSLLPVGGTTILGRRIVMGPEDALQAARDLGTRVVVPIHNGGEWMSVPPLSRHPGRGRRLAELATQTSAPFAVAVLRPGERVFVDENGGVNRPALTQGEPL